METPKTEGLPNKWFRGYRIYKATNLVNGKIYIGKAESGIKSRWNKHKTSARTRNPRDYGRFHRAMNKYGFDNFKIEQIAQYETKAEMMAAETYYIDLYDSTNPDKGYNMTRGGEDGTGYRFSEEDKQRMSQERKGKYVGEENPFFGKQHDEETRQFLSEFKKQHYQDNKEMWDQINIDQCDFSKEECIVIQKDYLDNHTPFEKLVERYDANLHAIHNIIHGTYMAIKGHSIITEDDIERIKQENANDRGKKSRLFTDEQEKEICFEYEQGASTGTLAEKHETSSTSICNVLRRNGVATRLAGSQPRAPNKSNKYGLTNESVLEMRAKWATNEFSQQELADKYGCSKQTVAHIVHRRTWTHI